MPFAVAAAGVGAAGAIAGGIMQSNAVKSGQQASLQAQQTAIQTAQNQLGPWTSTGAPANTQEASLLGLNGQPAADAAMSTFQASPGYQFQMQQGLRGVDAGAASQGILRSGATIKGEDEFAQGLANTTFGNYFNQLQQLSGNGLTAAGGITSASSGAANQMSTTDASGATAQANIYGNVAGSLGGQANSLFSNQNFQNLFAPSTGAVAPTTAYNNGLYENAQFAAQPAGTYGPFA